MVRIKFMLGLAVLVVMAAGSSVAQAQNPNNDTVVTTFDGTTGTVLGDNNNCPAGQTDDCNVPLVEPNPPAYNQCAANDGIDQGAMDQGEVGCFRFTGSVPANPPGAGCVFADTTDPTERSLSCSGGIISEGNYTNQVCGTGTVDGWATITTNIPGDTSIDIDYTIVFTAGQGVLAILGDGQDKHSDGGPMIVGGGAVSITPIPLVGGCVTVPATGFNVTGTANITMPDNGPG
jgi:hypothetical protein